MHARGEASRGGNNGRGACGGEDSSSQQETGQEAYSMKFTEIELLTDRNHPRPHMNRQVRKVFPWKKIGRTRAEGERIALATMVGGPRRRRKFSGQGP